MSHARFERNRLGLGFHHPIIQQYVIDKMTEDKRKSLRLEALKIAKPSVADQLLQQVEGSIPTTPTSESPGL